MIFRRHPVTSTKTGADGRRLRLGAACRGRRPVAAPGERPGLLPGLGRAGCLLTRRGP
jgi:hypothetical protein